MVSGAFKCVHVLVKVDGYTVGAVESMDVETSRDGGVEHYYGSTEGRHSIGGKKATFTVRRWFMADDDKDLFYDLAWGGPDQTPIAFGLSGEINGVANSQLSLSNCIAYKYKPRWGSANDLVAEEISGEATSWTSTI